MKTPIEDAHVFDTRSKALARKAITRLAGACGLALEPRDDTRAFVKDESTKLPELVARLQHIPGMVPNRRCLHLYLLALGGVQGDVIEIGSWQGKSTAYLAQACADSGNGVVHAIDTFQGNPGHEENYAVDGRLGDLESSFRSNISRAGLADWVKLHARSSAEAVEDVRASTQGARLLFVDGEHTYDALRQDLDLYTDLLLPGGLLVLDDYSPGFVGCVRAVEEHLSSRAGRYGTPFQQKNTLVVPRLPRG